MAEHLKTPANDTFTFELLPDKAKSLIELDRLLEQINTPTAKAALCDLVRQRIRDRVRSPSMIEQVMGHCAVLGFIELALYKQRKIYGEKP